LALRPKTLIESLWALPPGPARAAPEALPRIPIDVQFAFFCEELVATHVAADPMAMARPLVFPTGLDTGLLCAPPHFLPIAIDRLSKRPLEPETVRHPSLFTNSIPLGVPDPLPEPDPSAASVSIEGSTLPRPLDLALALARRTARVVSVCSGPALPFGEATVAPVGETVLEPALVPFAVVPLVPDAAGAAADGVESVAPLPVLEVEPFELVDVSFGAEAGEPFVVVLLMTT
jgi:hypothetical protein